MTSGVPRTYTQLSCFSFALALVFCLLRYLLGKQHEPIRTLGKDEGQETFRQPVRCAGHNIAPLTFLWRPK
jgi:hypothetical protein